MNKPKRLRKTKEEYVKALVKFEWDTQNKKTGPAWKEELLRRWSLNPSCE